ADRPGTVKNRFGTKTRQRHWWSSAPHKTHLTILFMKILELTPSARVTGPEIHHRTGIVNGNFQAIQYRLCHQPVTGVVQMHPVGRQTKCRVAPASLPEVIVHRKMNVNDRPIIAAL